MRILQHINHQHFDSIDSTHLYAKNNYHHLSPNQINLYTANMQTAGVGTNNRKWISAPNLNLYATYSMLIDRKNTMLLPHIPLVTALVIVKLLEQEGIIAKIKWINDVLVGGKKICGILSHSILNATSIDETKYNVLILSVGLNINTTSDILQSVDQPATSMLLASGQKCEIINIVHRLSSLLIPQIDDLFNKGFCYFQHQINKNLEFFDHKPIIFKKVDNSFNIGIIEGIDLDGKLIMNLNDKIEKYFDGSIQQNT
jgi:BirA family biotin operon repressor/biotin-[acetyl-CoA-carboxylase] ligase